MHLSVQESSVCSQLLKEKSLIENMDCSELEQNKSVNGSIACTTNTVDDVITESNVVQEGSSFQRKKFFYGNYIWVDEDIH